MTVRVRRTFEVPISQEDAWALLSDPAKRAKAISVVEGFEQEGEETVWHVALPVPGISATVAVRTHDLERDPPRYVKFTGKSRVFHVVGEHELTAIEDGTRVENRFVVESRVPGVERFFTGRLDDEIANIEEALRAELGDVEIE